MVLYFKEYEEIEYVFLKNHLLINFLPTWYIKNCDLIK